MHLQNLPTLPDHIPAIILIDRVYPSLNLFIPWLTSDQKFVIRLRKSDFKAEQAQMQIHDEKVTLNLTPQHIANHRSKELYEVLIQTPSSSICLHIVNILRADGSYVGVTTILYVF